MRSCIRGLVAAWIGFANPVASAGADVPDARRVERMVAGLEERFSHLTGDFECEGTFVEVRFTNRPITSRVVFKRSGDLVCLEQYYLSSGKETGRAWVNCRGPEQSFFLVREPGGPFVVRGVSSRRDEDHEASTTFLLMDGFARRYSKAVSGIKGDLSRAARASRFVVESVESSPDRGGLIDVTYKADGDGQDGAHRGSLTIDPASGWAVVAHELEQSDPETSFNAATGVFQYREVDGRLYPIVVSSSLYENETPLRSTDFRVDRIEARTIPAEEFRMTAYGIPAVAVASPARPGLLSPSGWPFWALLATAAVAFTAARAIRLRRAG